MGIIWRQAAVLIIGAVMVTWLLKSDSDVLALFMALWSLVTLLLLEWTKGEDIKAGKCGE